MTTRGTAERAYAIVRLDWVKTPLNEFPSGTGLHIAAGPVEVTVKEIVLSHDEARLEVERLNRLNAAKGCRYFWQETRLFSNGGSFGAEEHSAMRPREPKKRTEPD